MAETLAAAKPTMEYLSEHGDLSPKIYIVLGCHRSGTSFLAKALIDAGVAMCGKPIHFEDGRFCRLNKQIIEKAGGSWRQPPDEQALLSAGEKHGDEIQHLLNQNRSRFWGWKDPRQALTIRSYLPFLEDDDVYLIAIFRRPERVAASLSRLGQTNHGAELAQEYARRIIDGIADFMDH